MFLTEPDDPGPKPYVSREDAAAVREFFTARADRWDTRFPDDGPAFREAVAALGLAPSQAVLDAGCGTGRALEPLRAEVGPLGTVLGCDMTPAMLTAAVRAGRHHAAALAVADASRLPLRDASLDAVFAAGLLTHLPSPEAGLREFARVVRPGGALGIFHPVGRARLAARRGHALSPDDIRAEHLLRPLLAGCGWSLRTLTDAEDRYLAVADRV